MKAVLGRPPRRLRPALAALFLLILPAAESTYAQEILDRLSPGAVITVDSRILGESRKILLGLPSGYDVSDASYPVLYLLDGARHYYHAVSTTRFLAEAGRIPAMIVVAIPGVDRNRDLTPPFAADSLPGGGEIGGATGSWISSCLS